MVLMYPDPDVLSKHTFVPLTAAGDAVGDLLHERPDAAAARGRTTGSAPRRRRFTKFVHGSQVERRAETLVDVIEPPTYDALEHMITGIERRRCSATRRSEQPMSTDDHDGTDAPRRRRSHGPADARPTQP